MNADSKPLEIATPADESASDSELAILTPVEGDSRSTAEVLKELRRAFPDMPLAERVAALTALSRA